jgi:hypothetical protein
VIFSRSNLIKQTSLTFVLECVKLPVMAKLYFSHGKARLCDIGRTLKEWSVGNREKVTRECFRQKVKIFLEVDEALELGNALEELGCLVDIEE